MIKLDMTRMADALRLVRAGRAADATAMLQRRDVPATARPPARERTTPPLGPLRAAPSGKATTGMLARHYREGGDAIDYRLHLPPALAPGMPLVVMLHGCTQSPEDFARATRMNALADAHGIVVAWPEQSARGHGQRCWNWYSPAHQQRGRGEPALIAGLARAIVAEHGCDPDRVYVAGLSAGGAAAAILGAAYPDVFAAIGVHSGLACGSASTLPEALSAMRGARTGTASARRTPVPVIAIHGDRDTTVAPSNSRAIADAARADLSVPTTTTVETVTIGGRGVTREVTSDRDRHPLVEHWTVHGAGHVWTGGDPAGTYTDAQGPDASAEMLRFFLAHRLVR